MDSHDYKIGDKVMFNCIDGYGGEALVVDVREMAPPLEIRMLDTGIICWAYLKEIGHLNVKPEPSQDVDNINVALYDLHSSPEQNRQEIDRLLVWYQMLTGKDKPGFMA